ncbi:MAG: pyruvate, phosphate dikinase [Euryarchaeota archaeon]|nr:pyruvate, phosphate dikinase [Euryarchaeota archaeon]
MEKGTSNTGLPGLDSILESVLLGDNVVLQVDSIDDYVKFVGPFCREAERQGRPLIYFRFADHRKVVPDECQAEVHLLEPNLGFEFFISEILDIIDARGKGAFYVFDCLSDLSVDWYSDRMLGNFFMLACPYLYTYDTVAYFALIRNHHTPFAVDAIHRTSQVVMDIYSKGGWTYVHPLKVDGRRSPTMYMLHRWEGEEFVPVLNSSTTAEVLTGVPQPWIDYSAHLQDVWTRSFLKAQEFVETHAVERLTDRMCDILFLRLVRMAVTRDPRLMKLIERYMEFPDLVEIGKRMIGTGLIGGKSVGMLLSRAILKKHDPKWSEWLEPHDSFYIGSDVYYTYLSQNGCWWIRRKLNDPASGFIMDDQDRERMLTGKFPADIEDQFRKMLEYFGQSPIIVRSSSLLEDAYGNAFSGKYESVFLANQGTPQERLERFLDAVRLVYTSTLDREALAYRAHWGLLDRDEQMAVLVQRVSGSVYGDMFFPQVAGVGISYNPYAWSKEIDPDAGMMRLVFGLGTRAVDRVDDDYSRIVAINAPLRRPESCSEDVGRYSQRWGDVIDLKENRLTSLPFEEVVRKAPGIPLDIFTSRDLDLERRMHESGRDDVFSLVLTFEELLSKGSFVDRMREMLSTLEEAYEHPVDTEFTANFNDLDDYRMNLLQCRPFQAKGGALGLKESCDAAPDRVLLSSIGHVIGSSRAVTVDLVIYVVPEVYGSMRMSDRYAVARLIGKLTHLNGPGERPTILLAGPGRWATTSPEMGVPVSFSEINTVSILCEIISMHEGLVPEASLGTHFFNDLVESDMIYCAVYPERDGYVLDRDFFSGSDNRLASLLPDAAPFDSVIKVIDARRLGVKVCSDVRKQTFTCFR